MLNLQGSLPAKAGVAQLVEQLIRNQQVIGSSPIAGSRNPRTRSALSYPIPHSISRGATRYLTIRTFVGGAGAVPADRLMVNVVFDDGVVNV